MFTFIVFYPITQHGEVASNTALPAVVQAASAPAARFVCHLICRQSTRIKSAPPFWGILSRRLKIRMPKDGRLGSARRDSKTAPHLVLRLYRLNQTTSPLRKFLNAQRSIEAERIGEAGRQVIALIQLIRTVQLSLRVRWCLPVRIVLQSATKSA